jgi:hypothetical protein
MKSQKSVRYTPLAFCAGHLRAGKSRALNQEWKRAIPRLRFMSMTSLSEKIWKECEVIGDARVFRVQSCCGLYIACSGWARSIAGIRRGRSQSVAVKPSIRSSIDRHHVSPNRKAVTARCDVRSDLCGKSTALLRLASNMLRRKSSKSSPRRPGSLNASICPCLRLRDSAGLPTKRQSSNQVQTGQTADGKTYD